MPAKNGNRAFFCLAFCAVLGWTGGGQSTLGQEADLPRDPAEG
jgi:hypothetical protein